MLAASLDRHVVFCALILFVEVGLGPAEALLLGWDRGIVAGCWYVLIIMRNFVKWVDCVLGL